MADANGPYIIDQGDGLVLDGSGSSDPDTVYGDSIVTYAWDIAGGTHLLGGVSPSLTPAQVDALGLGSFQVILTVTDTFGASNSNQTTLQIYVNEPTAAFSANPNPAAPTQSISFDGSASSHDHPSHSIVQYGWDFDYDGTFDVDATGVAPSHSYGLFGTYTTALRVTDDNVPAKTDIATTVIAVDQGNRAPVADANGPYEVDLDTGLVLDGTGSSDPDVGYGDSIVSYDWDIASGTYLLGGVSPSLTPAEITALGVGEFQVILTVTDTFGAIDSDQTTLTVNSLAEVVDRHIFYNNSALDAGGDDDAAIDPSKTPLLQGTATSANQTSYSRGINGLMIDISGLTGTPTAGDIGVRVNQAANPDTWSPGPAPQSVTVRPGEGAGGSDRVTLTWADGAITNQWVEVTVLAGANTGLETDDVFYVGNTVGDINDDGAVDADDLATLFGEFGLRGGAELAADVNIDGRVNLTDFAIARNNFGTSVGTPTVPAAAPPAAAPAAASEPNVDILAESVTSGDGDAIIAGDIPLGLPLSVEVAPIDLPGPEPTPAPAATDDLLLSEGGLTPGESLDASLDTDDLLVDMLAESPLAVSL